MIDTSSFFTKFQSMNIIGILIFSIIFLLLCYWIFSKKISNIYILLLFSASFVGFSTPLVDSLATLVRWLCIFILFGFSIFLHKSKINIGIMLHWSYVIFGIISLIFYISLGWQLQRSALLLVTSIGIPITSLVLFRKVQEKDKLFKGISFTTGIVILLSFIALLNNTEVSGRFSAFSSGAPNFAVILGSLLPFSLWRSYYSRNNLSNNIWFLIYILGLFVLFFSGQRTGTLAGIVGSIPMIIYFWKDKIWFTRIILLIIFIFLAIFLFMQFRNDRISYLINRYTFQAGLSDRDIIWKFVLNNLPKNLFLGRGVGASELLLKASFHNAYLEVIYNSGIFGFVAFLFSQLYFVYWTLRILFKIKDVSIKKDLIIIFGYIFSFFILSFFESVGAGASNISVLIYLILISYVSKTKETYQIRIST